MKSRRIASLLLFLLCAVPAFSETVWTLRSGPVAVESIPVDPVQMVSAWRGQYSNGTDTVWVYATRSPQFFPPQQPNVFTAAPTPWTLVVFYPSTWSSEARQAWIKPWLANFLTLASLPEPGYPIVFPAVLR